MKKTVVILIQERCFSVTLLILHVPVTTIINFSKIVVSLNITPVINSFHFFFFLVLVFKRAVILVYKENYKLKKKMVSLVSVEVVGVYGQDPVVSDRLYWRWRGSDWWNATVPRQAGIPAVRTKTSAPYLCSNKSFLLFSKPAASSLCEPHVSSIWWQMKPCHVGIITSSRWHLGCPTLTWSVG